MPTIKRRSGELKLMGAPGDNGKLKKHKLWEGEDPRLAQETLQ